MIGVLLVDDHPVVLAGLSALVDTDSELTLVGSVGSYREVEGWSGDVAPDVCVLDLQLPDGDGIELGQRCKERWPATRVLILTMADDPSAVLRSLNAGLDGFVLKDSDPAELLAAIHATARGSVVLGRSASSPVVAAAGRPGISADLANLDARDREILALLVQGASTGQIADRLFLAPKTIRNRISELLSKLGVSDREAAIAVGRAAGLRPAPADGSAD